MTFQGALAEFANALISGFSAKDLIDITDLDSATVSASYAGSAGAGVLYHANGRKSRLSGRRQSPELSKACPLREESGLAAVCIRPTGPRAGSSTWRGSSPGEASVCRPMRMAGRRSPLPDRSRRSPAEYAVIVTNVGWKNAAPFAACVVASRFRSEGVGVANVARWRNALRFSALRPTLNM